MSCAGTAQPDATFGHTPTSLQSGLAAQLIGGLPHRCPAGPGRRAEPAWEGRDKRESSELSPVRRSRQVPSSSRHSGGKRERQTRKPAPSVGPTGSFSADDGICRSPRLSRFSRSQLFLGSPHALPEVSLPLDERSRRKAAAGASTPEYLVRLNLGGGTSAVNRSSSSTGP